MARRPTGQVLERKRQRGRVYALRFRAYGERRYVTLGSSDDGWTRQRAEEELHNVLADVRRGIWQPPEPDPAPVEPKREPTFHEFASEWFAAKRHELRPRTVEAYELHLTHHLLPFFARHRLSQITVEEVDRYRTQRLREADRRRAELARWREARERREDVGRAPQLLSNETINKTLVRLAQILEVAVEYGHLERNPAAGRRRRLKVARPQRSYLDRAEHIEALLDAADELDRHGRGDGRRALLATLVFAGLRLGELLALRWRDVDLAASRLHVGEAKTDAGVREVELLPALREELLAHRVRGAAELDALVFGTRTGRPQSPSNVRNRVLTPAVAIAAARLEAAGASRMPDRLTPHSLRRTFASLLFAIGRTAPEVMAQLGHTDPKLTLRIYARAMSRDAGENERLRTLTGLSGNVVGVGDLGVQDGAPTRERVA